MEKLQQVIGKNVIGSGKPISIIDGSAFQNFFQQFQLKETEGMNLSEEMDINLTEVVEQTEEMGKESDDTSEIPAQPIHEDQLKVNAEETLESTHHAQLYQNMGRSIVPLEKEQELSVFLGTLENFELISEKQHNINISLETGQELTILDEVDSEFIKIIQINEHKRALPEEEITNLPEFDTEKLTAHFINGNIQVNQIEIDNMSVNPSKTSNLEVEIREIDLANKTQVENLAAVNNSMFVSGKTQEIELSSEMNVDFQEVISEATLANTSKMNELKEVHSETNIETALLNEPTHSQFEQEFSEITERINSANEVLKAETANNEISTVTGQENPLPLIKVDFPKIIAGNQQAIEQVVEKVSQPILKELKTIERPGEKTITFDLSPGDLGKVQVKMKVTPDSVSLEFTVQSEQTKKMLETMTASFNKVLQKQEQISAFTVTQVSGNELATTGDGQAGFSQNFHQQGLKDRQSQQTSRYRQPVLDEQVTEKEVESRISILA
jgi:flagellar hook-length control protein FliK